MIDENEFFRQAALKIACYPDLGPRRY